MILPKSLSRAPSSATPVAPFAFLAICGASALLLALTAINGRAQQATPAPAANSQPAAAAPSSTATPPAAQAPASTDAPQQTEAPVSPSAPTPATAPAESQPAQTPTAAPNTASQTAEPPGSITEDELRKQLEGKDLFLRGGYLDNNLTFNEHGVLIGHSPQGSYTLSGIRIDKVRLMKHKVELTGARYGLHFLGAMPYEDPTKAVDRVNVTPKKKEVRITIDRELVVKPKKENEKGKGKEKAPQAPATKPAPTPTTATNAPAPPAAAPAPNPETTDVNEAQAEMAKAPEAERPADAKSVTTTLSPAHANKVLEEALNNMFAQGFDARMMAAMPGFWKLYYDAVANKTDYQPADPNVMRQNMVDKKAQLKSTFEPPSNQFAQDYGVAGMSEYHVIIGADGKPGEIAVARPIIQTRAPSGRLAPRRRAISRCATSPELSTSR